ncbi:MAG: isoleucyl-tRNA synthetase [Parcubacteria group bacterium Gr01-1014_72]|nr:MAG: isoleucyl-tRNA synthetase [Parcubacteria group bacterium Gr01-1014_72]
MDEQKKTLVAEREEKILAFWADKKIFEKSLAKPAPKGDFVFYDGPPFASGLPHYGHILAGTIKDVIPRYKTMRGFRVPRRWGWDCHGLPVENEVEKELQLKAKKDIVSYGLQKFNETARKTVMRYADDWRRIIPRMGRFVDMDNDYRTMDSSYTESVWWAFKTLYEKNLAYEGFKSMHLCPRCETTLSNFEVTQGYKDVTDLSVCVKFSIFLPSGDLPQGDNSQFSKTYLIAWTTTPWTLPGNVALAVNPDKVYAEVKNVNLKVQNDSVKFKSEEGVHYILAKERAVEIFKEYEYEIAREVKGSELVGLSYEPLFEYYAKDSKLPNRENGWKVYAGDFVTTTEGTGIVHIAPAFGEDDYQLSLKEKLPFIQHIGTDGRFKPEVKDFAGLQAKPKGNPQETDKKIIAHLTARGALFAMEPITHSYPHCWRCDTPLLNYAAVSWFVRVVALRDKLLSENKKIGWVPSEIGDGRFGKWLEGARDWAISRSRFWGAPIPVWRCDGCTETRVFGNTRELLDVLPKSGNKYFLMRHGEADNNVEHIISSELSNPHHLTEVGKRQVREVCAKLKNKHIDLVFVSPFLRTQETAKIVAEEIGLSKGAFITDERIRELRTGAYNLRSIRDFTSYFSSPEERFVKATPGGESYTEVKRRMGGFLSEIDASERFRGKNILIITHDAPAWMLCAAAAGADVKKALQIRGEDDYFIKNGEVKELSFTPLPHNADFELDLHRPFIDDVVFPCAPCGAKRSVMRRVPDVFDCWFESGSMPFGEAGYRGEALPMFQPQGGLFKKRRGYPADFIAEGLDQTRGWFYSLLVLGVSLFGAAPFKRVVTNGIILAEDGQKMSKRLKNYPDPMTLVGKYGADALRLYLLSSPAVHGEELRFSERGVDEVAKKVFGRLDNVLQFYKLYAPKLPTTNYQLPTSHVLDNWILVRLAELSETVTTALEAYTLDAAARPLGDFVDDLSTWYLRRSRERIKGGGDDAKDALKTLQVILLDFAKLIAPFAPFFAERLYQSVHDANIRMGTNDTNSTDRKESVHLENWPEKTTNYQQPATNLLFEMGEVRRLVSLGLEARAKANVKVRQPLQSVTLRNPRVSLEKREELLTLIKDELNVKEVRFNKEILDEVEIDTTLTPELKKEGDVREAVRTIQDLRKEKGLKPGERVALATSPTVAATGLLQEFEEEIKKAASLSKIEHGAATAGDFELR